MTLVDHFICRREGHIPSIAVTAGAEFIVSTISACVRCGKPVETPGAVVPCTCPEAGLDPGCMWHGSSAGSWEDVL